MPYWQSLSRETLPKEAIMTASTPNADGEVFLPLEMTPQEWETYLADLDYGQKVTVARQDAFLQAFADVGSIRSAAPGAGITRQAVHNWIKDDQYHFRSRFEQAILQFREQLQDLAVERVKVQKPNDNPVLLIAMLNAHWPEKYRRDTVVIGSDSSKEMLAELRKLTALAMGSASVTEEALTAGQQAEAAMSRVLGPGKVTEIVDVPGRTDGVP